MKLVFVLSISVLIGFTTCKGQQRQDNVQPDCLSQENKQKVYAALKELVLKNGDTIITPRYENNALFRLQYDDLYFTHRFVPNKNKNLPNFNMETIDVVGEKLYYQLVYGGHFGDKEVTIEIKDFPEEKGKIESKKVEQHFCEVLSKMNFNIRLSAKEAVEIAKKDAGGFLGTWTQISLKNGNWHICSSSKSADSPNYYIIDAQYGEILLKLDNTDDPDQKKKLEQFLEKERQ